MQYDVSTPAEYMTALDDDWRRDTLEALRALIREKAPELVEGIAYRMLSYSDGRTTIFALNAQKNYVSFYVGDADKVDPSGSLLDGLDRGKGCIRFRKSVAVADTRMDEFIARAAELRRQGIDMFC